MSANRYNWWEEIKKWNLPMGTKGVSSELKLHYNVDKGTHGLPKGTDAGSQSIFINN